MRDYSKYSAGGKVTSAQAKTLDKHSSHHSAKHMAEMKVAMQKGKTFTQAHKAAQKKVGT